MPKKKASAKSAPALPAIPEILPKIDRFVVLMLENRSFDHLFGFLKSTDPRVAGLTGDEFNFEDPNVPQPGQKHVVYRPTKFDMPFDPPHEFEDVQVQLHGPSRNHPGQANPPADPARMSGFIARTLATVPNLYPEDAARVMSCFQPDQLPVLTTLAQQFALFNGWYSSLPGPTWPNRFFIHAATSGGLNYSPRADQIVAGFSFKNGTLYDRLNDAKRSWRIYYDGLPQSIGISSLRWEYLKHNTSPFAAKFHPMAAFEADIAAGDLPEYTFIEPNYDTGNNYLNGNSMHPLNDIRKGELLVKRVYETLRNSAFWPRTMFIITFDEHGGFYDHVSPPATTPTGDDHRYANGDRPFAFDRLGVRVPTVVVSPYTAKGTIVGTAKPGDLDVFDHSSVPATLAKRFGFPTLTQRDANARTLDAVLNLATPRLTSADAPTRLPNPPPDKITAKMSAARRFPSAFAAHAPLSENQQSFLALALACDLEVTVSSKHQALRNRYQRMKRQKDAADYMQEVQRKLQPKGRK